MFIYGIFLKGQQFFAIFFILISFLSLGFNKSWLGFFFHLMIYKNGL